MVNLPKLYQRYGVQVELWLALQLFPREAGFATIKTLYELVSGRVVSKETVSNILRLI